MLTVLSVPQVRLYDPKSGRVARVRESRLLHPGQLLLFPSNVAPPAGSSPGADRTGHQTPLEQHQHQHRGQGQGHRATVQRGLTSAASVTAAAAAAAGSAAAATALTPERVRRWVLGVHPGVVFVNKPAGVLVHGRAAGDAEPPGSGGRAGGGAAALDDVLRRALRYGEHDEPRWAHTVLLLGSWDVLRWWRPGPMLRGAWPAHVLPHTCSKWPGAQLLPVTACTPRPLASA